MTRLKSIPIIDTLISGIKYWAIFSFATMIVHQENLFIPIGVMIFLWACASHIFSSIQDLLSDQTSKIKTTAVFMGLKRSNKLSLILFIIAMILPILFYWPLGIVVSILMSVFVLNISFFIKYKSDAQARKFERGWQNHLWLTNIVVIWLSTIMFISQSQRLWNLDSINIISVIYIVAFLIQFMLILYNLFGLKKPGKKIRQTDWPKISVIIHTLNDSDHISSTMLALLGQHYPDFEIIYTDLGSTDNTTKIVENYQDPRLKIVNIKPREKYWRINTWANQQLIKKTGSDIVLMLSADTVLLPDTLTYIALAMEDNLDVLSIMPADQNRTFSQKFILSQNRYFLLGCFPAAYLNKNKLDFALSTSSFLAFNKKRTKVFDNFATIKRSPLSNIDFCSKAKQHRLKTAFYLASDLAISHNNANLKDIFLHNYQNFYPSLKFNMPLTTFLLIGGFFAFCMPVAFVATELINFGVANIILLSIAIILALINHIIIAINGKQNLIATLFFPVTALISLILIFISMINYELLKPRWQNRTEVHTI